MAENPKKFRESGGARGGLFILTKGRLVPASKSNLELKAVSLLNAFEKAGKTVKSVTVEGRKIQLTLAKDDIVDEFDGVDMRHG